MKTLSLVLSVVVAIVSFSGEARAGEAEWQTDFKAAMKVARAEKRPVLVNFTGSDWCGWCMKLDEETFSKATFQDFAGENLVLVMADFPNAKPQTEELKKQNEDLQAKYGVRGFPTFVLLSPTGRKLAEHVGYLPGGPDAMVAWIKESANID